MNTTTQTNQQAIVIGGSIAGLMAARILSAHFERVIIVERDHLADQPEARPGQPQAQHLHALLNSGKQIFEQLFPGLQNSLTAAGATLVDLGNAGRWFIGGDYRVHCKSGIDSMMLSRPLLEWQIRQRVLACPNVQVLDQTSVEGLITTDDRQCVIGIRMHDRATPQQTHSLMANLVIDTSGRNSPSPRWLSDLGYQSPPETVVKIDVGYATRIYRRDPNDADHPHSIMISADPPHSQRSGNVFAIEGDRWMVTLAGWGTEQPPTDEAEFLAFIQNLPVPDLYNLVQSTEPLSGIVGYRFPTARRRHYEKITRFPAGYLVMGDALCSFDPIYGQGMTSAALQAERLRTLLQQSVHPQKLAYRFFKQAAKVIDTPWQLAVGEDFRFPQTQGKKPLGTDLINAYGTLVQKATHRDPIVYGEFLKVVNLLAPPTALFHPKMIWRVLHTNWQA